MSKEHPDEHPQSFQHSKQEESKNGEDLCCICMGEFRNMMRTLCRHSFCETCLSSWMKQNQARQSTCPLCRAPFQGDTVALGVDVTARSPWSQYSRMIDGDGGVCLYTTSNLSAQQQRDEDMWIVSRIHNRFIERISQPLVEELVEELVEPQVRVLPRSSRPRWRITSRAPAVRHRKSAPIAKTTRTPRKM